MKTSKLTPELNERINGLLNQTTETKLNESFISSLQNLIAEGFDMDDIVTFHQEKLTEWAIDLQRDMEADEKADIIAEIGKIDLKKYDIEQLREIQRLINQ